MCEALPEAVPSPKPCQESYGHCLANNDSVFLILSLPHPPPPALQNSQRSLAKTAPKGGEHATSCSLL